MSHPADVPGGKSASVDVRLFSVPDLPQQLRVRILGDGHGLLTHFVPKLPTICRGDGHCDPKLHRNRPQWRGYYPAMIACRLPKPHWEIHVLEITERLGEIWWSEVLDGQEWVLERIQEGKYKVLTGHFVRAFDPAELPKPCKLEPVLQRVYRLSTVPPSVNPKLLGREWREAVPAVSTAPPAVEDRPAVKDRPAVEDRPAVAQAADDAARAAIPFGGDQRLAGLFRPQTVADQAHSNNNGRRR